MKLHKQYLAGILLYGISEVALSSPITEKFLISEAKKENAANLQRKLQTTQTELQQEQFQLQYTTQAYGQYAFGKSEHQPISPFSPVINPSKNFQIGVKRRLPKGFNLDGQIYSEQISIPKNGVNDATTTGAKFTVSMDLYKNYLGKDDQKRLDVIEHNQKALEIKNYLDEKSYEFQVRKLYWSLVANRESLKVARKIKALAQSQYDEVLKRKRLSVADNGEVSRYAAQLSDSESTISALDYQYEKMLLGLKQLVPSLNADEVEIAPVNLDQTITLANKCISKISGQKQPSWEYTKIDDYLASLETMYKSKSVEYTTLGKSEVTLFGTMNYAGSESTYGKSIEEFGKDGKNAYQIGVAVNVPLGEAYDKTRSKMYQNDILQLSTVKAKFEAEALSRATQMQKLIPLLLRTIETQKKSSKDLENIIKDSKQKFQQARIGVDRLILDQNAYIASIFNQIETQLIVIHEIYDYLALFTEMPCEINKL